LTAASPVGPKGKLGFAGWPNGLSVLLLAAKGFVFAGAEPVAKGLNGDGRCVVWLGAENIWTDDATGVAIIYVRRGA
jgi:hypothetical protein